MISPIEKKCVKCGQPWEQHDQNYCHSPVEKNDAEIERIVSRVDGWLEDFTTERLACFQVENELRRELTTFRAHIEADLLEDIRNRVAEVMRDALGLRTVAHYKQESNDYIRGASDQYLADRELVENLQATIIALITKHKEQLKN